MLQGDWQAAKAALREILAEELGFDNYELTQRFEGGTIIIQPADKSLKPREIPVEAFFKKVTAVRERLRVLEQKLNNHPNLSDTEKAELQGYISRAYGSLTTLNFLFADKDDYFQGMKSS